MGYALYLRRFDDLPSRPRARQHLRFAGAGPRVSPSRRALAETPTSPTGGTSVTLSSPTATSVTDTGLNEWEPYSYAVFTRDAAGNTSAAATITALTLDGSAPAPVRDLRVTGSTSSSIALSWRNPLEVDYGIIVRRATGSAAPSSPTSGVAVPLAHATATSVTDTGLTAGTTYIYAVFARDAAGNTSTAATLTKTAVGTWDSPLAISLPYTLNGHITFGDRGDEVDEDVFRFTIATKGRLNIDLSGLDADVDLYLMTESGLLLSRSEASGTSSESLSAQLGPGTYRVIVAPWGPAVSGYPLRVTHQTDPDEAGNTISSAQAVALPYSIDGQITSGNEDWYRVTTTTAGALKVHLSGLSDHIDLCLYNASGIEIAASKAPKWSNESLSMPLAAGTYYVRVAPNFMPAVSGYSLALNPSSSGASTVPTPAPRSAQASTGPVYRRPRAARRGELTEDRYTWPHPSLRILLRDVRPQPPR